MVNLEMVLKFFFLTFFQVCLKENALLLSLEKGNTANNYHT